MPPALETRWADVVLQGNGEPERVPRYGRHGVWGSIRSFDGDPLRSPRDDRL